MSFCPSCGKHVLESDVRCPYCKSIVRKEEAEGHTSGMAIASLVCGIIGIICMLLCFFSFAFHFGSISSLCVRFSFPAYILAVVFGIIGKKQASRPGVKGRRMAIAGLTFGSIGLVLWVLAAIFGAIIWFSVAS